MSEDPFGLSDDEKLISLQKEEAIKKLVSHLSQFEKDFYYLSTIEISHEIHHLIKGKKLLNQKEFEAVQDLSPEDIKIILGLNSSSNSKF